jgi:hypothetical protein
VLLSIATTEVHAADLRIIVHVANHASVTNDDLCDAQGQVSAVYKAAGVVMDFSATPRPASAADLAHHVELVLLSDAMVAMEVQDGKLTTKVVGHAARSLRRAYIFYTHLSAHARRTRSPISRALAIAIAHEIAHLLLPGHSHSSGGIMQAELSGRVIRVPRFTTSQAAAVRGFLAESVRHARDRLAGTPASPPVPGPPPGRAAGAELKGAVAARDLNQDLRVR